MAIAARRIPPTSRGGRKTRHQLWKKLATRITDASSCHEPLSPEDVKELATKMRTEYRWSKDPRPHQMHGTRAQLEGRDAVIQAPTGSGKTAIIAGPYVWRTTRGKLTIVVSPLTALQEEMVSQPSAKL